MRNVVTGGSRGIGLIARRSALRHLPEADDVASVVEYLLGEGGRNITGTLVTVDAGNTASLLDIFIGDLALAPRQVGCPSPQPGRSLRGSTQRHPVRCPSIVLQAFSASARVRNAEPPILIAPLPP